MPAAEGEAWHVEHVVPSAGDPSAIRARTRPPTPRASSVHTPNDAAAPRDARATPSAGTSCVG